MSGLPNSDRRGGGLFFSRETIFSTHTAHTRITSHNAHTHTQLSRAHSPSGRKDDMSTAHHSRVAGLTERPHYITDLQRPSNTMSRQQASTYGPESGEGGRGSGDGQYLQRAGQQSGERTRHSGENSHKGYPFQGSPHHGDEGAARRRHERRTELSMKKRVGPGQDFAKFDSKFAGARSAPKSRRNLRSEARFALMSLSVSWAVTHIPQRNGSQRHGFTAT